tara:strand:- start:1945 stop:2166 length:222 start_codon:yes stop_codon:yes gene_type:complete
MIDQKQLKLKIDNLVNFIELQESLSKKNSLDIVIDNSEYIKELKSELKILAGKQISYGSSFVGASYRSLLLNN